MRLNCWKFKSSELRQNHKAVRALTVLFSRGDENIEKTKKKTNGIKTDSTLGPRKKNNRIGIAKCSLEF